MSDGKLLLDVEHLRVGFRTEEGVVQAVDDVSFQLHAGEVLAIVGESGSGKSVSALTLMGLTEERKEDVRRCALMLAQTGWTSEQFAKALTRWARMAAAANDD